MCNCRRCQETFEEDQICEPVFACIEGRNPISKDGAWGGWGSQTDWIKRAAMPKPDGTLGGPADLEDETDSAPDSGCFARSPAGGSKRKRSASSACDTDCESSDGEAKEDGPQVPFSFKTQGQWVCVFYDNNYYIGQVLDIKNEETADVKFLEKTRGRCDFFKWPACEDIAEVDAKFVFSWDFEVNIHSSDGRLWSVPEVKQL